MLFRDDMTQANEKTLASTEASMLMVVELAFTGYGAASWVGVLPFLYQIRRREWAVGKALL